MDCDRNCGNCGGCGGRELTLSEEEIRVLRTFGEFPFQPVARKAGEQTPVCREHTFFPETFLGSILLLLEKKGLIALDYDMALGGFSYEAYPDLPVRGSMALTGRGQDVLDLLEINGVSPEE